MNASKNLNNLKSSDIANLATAILRLNDSVSTLNSLVRGSIAAKPIYSVKDLSLLLGKSEDSIYKLSRQASNPLPLREFIAHDEFMTWFARATRIVSNASKN